MYRYSRVGWVERKSACAPHSTVSAHYELLTVSGCVTFLKQTLEFKVGQQATRGNVQQIWNPWMCVTKLHCNRTAKFDGEGSLTTAMFRYHRIPDFALVRSCSAAIPLI
jgi:hypothetical protein